MPSITRVESHFRHGAGARLIKHASDPITGQWIVGYGDFIPVDIALNSGTYTVTSLAPTRLGQGGVPVSTCYLPVGTVLDTFTGTAPNYSGVAGLWYTSNCSFGYWDPMTCTFTDGISQGLTCNLSGGYGVESFARTSIPTPNAVKAMSSNGGASVSWQEAASSSSISGFNIREINADGSPGSTVANAGPTATSVVVNNLSNCTPYRFEVQAMVGGSAGDWSAASDYVTPHQSISSSPQVAVILMEGIDSSTIQDAYNPLSVPAIAMVPMVD